MLAAASASHQGFKTVVVGILRKKKRKKGRALASSTLQVSVSVLSHHGWIMSTAVPQLLLSPVQRRGLSAAKPLLSPPA